ncbi:DUF1611 domain-containing protein [Sphingomonas sp. RT2P30]|uniref:DUF1611 domain-containing protein n=1 Tax=Parasphingomonas halimpatiens TaxID=3096162 RepID=UPI002FC773BE
MIFLGDVKGEPNTKTAFGVRDWLPDETLGQVRLPGCDVDLGLPELTMAEAYERGARSLLIGAAPVGGLLPSSWTSSLIAALDAGLDIVSGLHTRLTDIAEVRERAAVLGRALHDVRSPTRQFAVANGRKRGGKRMLMVGTDCALGKKYTALAIGRALAAAGVDADFRATGQTGIMIAGSGIAIDAVVADFIAGAAELLSPEAPDDHWDVIEGQGSLFHPAYAGVTLGLIHGSQADALVLCHHPLRQTLNGYPDYPLPDLGEAMDLYLRVARLTNPAVRFVGISLNTSQMAAAEATQLMAELGEQYGLPCFDPIRSDLRPLVDHVLGSAVLA